MPPGSHRLKGPGPLREREDEPGRKSWTIQNKDSLPKRKKPRQAIYRIFSPDTRNNVNYTKQIQIPGAGRPKELSNFQQQYKWYRGKRCHSGYGPAATTSGVVLSFSCSCSSSCQTKEEQGQEKERPLGRVPGRTGGQAAADSEETMRSRPGMIFLGPAPAAGDRKSPRAFAAGTLPTSDFSLGGPTRWFATTRFSARR